MSRITQITDIRKKFLEDFEANSIFELSEDDTAGLINIMATAISDFIDNPEAELKWWKDVLGKSNE